MNEEIEIPVQKFGTWEVLPNGDIFNEDGRFVHGERVAEEDWILHAITQNWDLNEFVPAYYQAIKTVKLETVTFVINHK